MFENAEDDGDEKLVDRATLKVKYMYFPEERPYNEVERKPGSGKKRIGSRITKREDMFMLLFSNSFKHGLLDEYHSVARSDTSFANDIDHEVDSRLN